MQLLLRQWNSMAERLLQRHYQPLLEIRQLDDGGEVNMADEWCYGYALAIQQGAAGWAPALECAWPGLDTILRFGTEAGWELHAEEPLDDAEYEDRVELLGLQAMALHASWRAEREAAPAGGTLGGALAPCVPQAGPQRPLPLRQRAQVQALPRRRLRMAASIDFNAVQVGAGSQANQAEA